MYPETNSLPKQHTSQSLLRGMRDVSRKNLTIEL